ncbi:MAG: HAD family hydrolase [Arsenicicoccus sp.]|nr:MAG: HAD family hydrolase [Arsenicicoccus sp.]
MTPPRPAPTTAVLFDFDGTLADTVDLIVASYEYALTAPGAVASQVFPHASLPPATTIRSWIGRPLRETLEDVRPGEGDALVERYREHNLDAHDRLIRRVEGTAGLVRDLVDAGVPVGVVSSKRAGLVRRGMSATGIPDLEVVVGLEETTRHKPHPEPLLEGARRLGVEAASCAYVGDAVVDVQAAVAAGMRPVAVTWGAGTAADLRAAGPDRLVDDVPALRHALGLPPGRA